jgi:spore germination protein GerM
MRRTALIAIMLVATGLTACGGTGTTTDPTEPVPTTSAPESETPSSEPTQTPTDAPTDTPADLPQVPAGQDGAVAYFLYAPAEAENPYLAAVWVPGARDLADALSALLDGPEGAAPAQTALSSTIPDGTTLLGVTMDGTTAVVDLTGTYASGGGSASMFARLAQLTFTATQFDEVEDVRLLLDGAEVETFSAEGIELDQPIEAADWFDTGVLPKLFVQRPALGETVGGTFTMTGFARDMFEATFNYEISDSADEVFAQGPITAEGSEGWNAFSAEVTYVPDEELTVTLTVAEYSPKDGAVVFTSSYPITIDPAR